MSKAVAIDTALRGEVISLRVRSIIDHEAKADDLSAKSDEHRWEAARLIAEELEAGKTQRELAGQIGKSQSHVQRMAKVWTVYGERFPRESFNQAYHSPEVRGTPKPKGLPKGGEPTPPAPGEPSPGDEALRHAKQSWRNVCRAAELVIELPRPDFETSEKQRMIRQLEAALEHLREL